MNIKIKKINPRAKIPTQATDGDAGYDLYAVRDMVIPPLSRDIVATGIQIEIPKGYYGRIAPRSGLAVKKGIDVLAGVIDSGYRGEIILKFSDNNIGECYKIGERVGQIMIMPHPHIEFVEVDDLSDSDRGDGGFGSTG